MKTIMFILIGAVALNAAHAQTESRKSTRKQRKEEKAREIESLVDSMTFVFSARQALPQGGRTVDLTTNPNFVRFYSDSIHSEMPYFGRAYSIDYGGDGGLKFKGKTDYTVEKRKKGRGYIITGSVKTVRDTFNLTLTLSYSGSASLSISSNQRSTISYTGEIVAIENEEDK